MGCLTGHIRRRKGGSCKLDCLWIEIKEVIEVL